MLLVAGILILVYTFSRACLLSITWDEAYSYMEFVRNGVVLPDKFDEMSANNHLLNTFLNIQLTKWLGVSEFILRIPALFGHILFLLFSAKLLLNFHNKWLILASYFIIHLNPYLLDFFSLARGYGLSLGLMMTSIYYFYRFLHTKKAIDSAVSILVACLSVLANLVLLNFCLALFAAICWFILMRCFSENQKTNNKLRFFISQLFFPILFIACLLTVIVPFALGLKEAKALFFGASNGFWKDTIGTITDRSFYESGYSYWFQRIAKGFMILVLIHAAVLCILRFVKKRAEGETTFLQYMLIVLFLSGLSTVLQHHLFGTLYLIDRTALFLVVLFTLVLVFLIREISLIKKNAALIGYFSATTLLVHFFLSFNLTYVLEWKFDADTRTMLADLEKEKQILPGRRSMSIGVPFWFETGINYYRDINDLTWLNATVRSDQKDPMYDFLYLLPSDAKLLSDSIVVIKTYPLTGNVLAKPKKPAFTGKLCFIKKQDFEELPGKHFFMDRNVEFSPGFSYILNDSITKEKTAVVQFKVKVKSTDLSNCNVGLIITFLNSSGTISWQRAWIKDYINKTDEWTDVVYTSNVPVVAKQGDELKSYIWNPDKQEVFADDMQMEWISYSK